MLKTCIHCGGIQKQKKLLNCATVTVYGPYCIIYVFAFLSSVLETTSKQPNSPPPG